MHSVQKRIRYFWTLLANTSRRSKEHLNKFLRAIVTHKHAEIRQMWVTDFEQLFARSKNLIRCYDTIMFVINCSETLFDLQSRLVNSTGDTALAKHDSAGSRYDEL